MHLRLVDKKIENYVSELTKSLEHILFSIASKQLSTIASTKIYTNSFETMSRLANIKDPTIIAKMNWQVLKGVGKSFAPIIIEKFKSEETTKMPKVFNLGTEFDDAKKKLEHAIEVLNGEQVQEVKPETHINQFNSCNVIIFFSFSFLNRN